MRPTKQISVVVLAKSRPGSYIDVLYTLLKKYYNVKSMHFSDFSVKRLVQTLSLRPIIHIHWIEHKYTLGQINTIGRYTKFFIIPIAFFYLLALVILRFCFSFPIVTTLHNVIPHRILFPSFERSIFKITLGLSSIVYVHTDRSIHIAISMYGVKKRRIVKIPHGNWSFLRTRLWDGESARRKIGIEKKAFVMCFLGRISPDKGLHLLLGAIKDMKINRPFYLIVAGSPINKEYFDFISKEVSRVNDFIRILFFPRWVSDSELGLFLTASDVGVFPYVKTSTPASALLFMSFGKAVIVPALPEVKEFIGDDSPLFYDGTQDGLKRTIEKAIFNIDLKQLGEKARKRSLLFDWKDAASLTYLSYLQILDRGK